MRKERGFINVHSPAKLGHVFTAEPLKIWKLLQELVQEGINGLAILNCSKLFQKLFLKVSPKDTKQYKNLQHLHNLEGTLQ